MTDECVYLLTVPRWSLANRVLENYFKKKEKQVILYFNTIEKSSVLLYDVIIHSMIAIILICNPNMRGMCYVN